MGTSSEPHTALAPTDRARDWRRADLAPPFAPRLPRVTGNRARSQAIGEKGQACGTMGPGKSPFPLKPRIPLTLPSRRSEPGHADIKEEDSIRALGVLGPHLGPRDERPPHCPLPATDASGMMHQQAPSPEQDLKGGNYAAGAQTSPKQYYML